ncbi:MAG: CAP domain-containing protein [Austwickia sp.]|jgi:uncharacterized protein YkwD|nr:CAP domain-containing protein [Austwickia sp.]MBK8435286.1 CAP domain-containing protein [Austwickia sp.]MBK9101163.1 CAP domain-containing protein [Austwickia sp.]
MPTAPRALAVVLPLLAGCLIPATSPAQAAPAPSNTCRTVSAGRSCVGPAKVVRDRVTKDRYGRRVRTVVRQQTQTLTTARTITTTLVTTTTTTVGRARPVVRTTRTARVTPVPARLSSPTPAPTPAPEPATLSAADWEHRVFELTNAQRVAHGVAPFLPDPCASAVARDWSATMLATSAYVHRGDWVPLRECAQAQGSWQAMAENIYRGNPTWDLTPETAVQGWMASPGHRANILNPALTRLGVGFAGRYGGNHFATQNFWG